MRGWIKQRSKGSWRIAIDVGTDPSGRRLQHFETVRGTKASANKRLAELLIEIEKGGYVKTPRKLTLREYLGDWVKNHAGLNCRAVTAEGYKYRIDHYLCPALGQIPLATLRPQHISRYLSNRIEQGQSARSVLHDYRLLHKALKDAVQLGILAVNPCDGVQPPKPDDKEMSFLTPAAIGTFLTHAQESPFPYYYLFRTMLYTGLRRSEALALTWRNLDLDKRTLTVTETLHRTAGGKFVLQPPKTKNSRRVIDLSESLTEVLQEYRSQVEDQRVMLNTPLADSDLVFAHVGGSPLDPSTVSHEFLKTARRAGLQIRLHDLRHTYATLMLAAGVNVKALSQSLGHSNVSITLGIYSHLLPGTGKSAAEQFDKLLNPYLKEGAAKKSVAISLPFA
jgi:integrase